MDEYFHQVNHILAMKNLHRLKQNFHYSFLGHFDIDQLIDFLGYLILFQSEVFQEQVVY